MNEVAGKKMRKNKKIDADFEACVAKTREK
jgi:hypothetical protein